MKAMTLSPLSRWWFRAILLAALLLSLALGAAAPVGAQDEFAHATITLVATRRMWEDGGGLGAVLWLGFLALSIYAIYSVWRAYREY